MRLLRYPPHLTIGLLGHSVASDNFGVGALTVSHIEILRRIGDELNIKLRFRIIVSHEWRDPYVAGSDMDVQVMRTRSYIALRDGLYSVVRNCDIVVDITGGDSFTDIYGLMRFFRLSLAKAVVLLACRPLVFAPQTIGPFQRRWTRMIANQIMSRARAVVARDGLSMEFLRQFYQGSNMIESTDVAFRLPYTPHEKNNGDRVRVGLNISGLLFNGGYTQSNMFDLSVDYPELARSLIGYFAKRPECEVHLISHVISDRFEVEDDYRVCKMLAREFSGIVLAPRFADPSEAKSYIASMDFFCGSRMHACIAAFSSGVPVLPIAYSRKFAGVFGSLGYNWLADCKSETSGQIMAKVTSAYEQRAELKKQIGSGMKAVEQKLSAYEMAVRTCMTENFQARP